MKRLIAANILLSATLWAQSGPAPEVPKAPVPGNGPSYSQLYCSGFVTRKAVPRTRYVLGSKESPYEDRIPGNSTMFLRGGQFVAGQRYTLLRQIKDPNRETFALDQPKKLARLGMLYEDVGWVTVKSVVQGTAVASFDFSCGEALPGDLVVPFEERPQVAFRTVEPEIDPFRPNNGAPKGHILGARDFVGQLGTGYIVYTDFGSAKGAKVGDYLYVQRGYNPDDLNRVDAASLKLPIGADATSVNPVKVKPKDGKYMPNRVVGELLVLKVNTESSTALITRSFAEMALGDVVQDESSQSAGAAASDVQAEPDACHPSRLQRLEGVVHLGHGCKTTQGD